CPPVAPGPPAQGQSRPQESLPSPAPRETATGMTVMTGDKKSLKKWLTRKRNLRDLLMLQHREHVKQEEDRQKEHLQASRRQTSREPKAADPVWSAKTQDIRNRLTDKKRAAAERWNRFSGTEDSGGRGL